MAAANIPPSAGKTAQFGFSMIELIMTIVIIGILSASARALLSTETFDQRYLVDDTLMALRYAQQFAVTQGCSVQFNIDNSGFRLKQDSNCTNTTAAAYNTDITRPNSTDLYENLEMNDTTVTATNLVFYPQGWACAQDGSSSATTSIIFSGAYSKTLKVDCGSGYSYED
jgi:prepilin-type N-terminal cleavage/methylation domain-containing protein